MRQSGLRRQPHWLLTPDPEARVVEVATQQEYDALADTYPNPEGNPAWKCLNYEALSRDWDALRLTNPDALVAPGSTWDVESTCWFRWRFISVSELRV